MTVKYASYKSSIFAVSPMKRPGNKCPSQELQCHFVFASKVGDVRLFASDDLFSIFMHSNAKVSGDMFSDSAFISNVGKG